MPKQINFASAAEPVKRQILIDSFGGIDLSSSPTDVDKSRSPDAPNMMPDTKGNPKKRPGFEHTGKFEGRINGRFEINGKEVIHAGSALYIEGKRVWSGMADERSSGQIIKGNLYIFDGLCALKCDGYDAYPISYDAYVPTVLISKNADFYYFDENFSGDGSTKRFTLSKAADEITAKVDGASAAVTLENGNEAVFASAPADGTAIVIAGKVNQEPGGSSQPHQRPRQRPKISHTDTGHERNQKQKQSISSIQIPRQRHLSSFSEYRLLQRDFAHRTPRCRPPAHQLRPHKVGPHSPDKHRRPPQSRSEDGGDQSFRASAPPFRKYAQ